MPSKKKDVARERERRAWQLRQQGWTQERISQELGVTQEAISAALRRIEKQLADEFKEQAEEIKARQTAQLERIASQALDQWIRSCEDAERIATVTGRAKATENGAIIYLPDQETTTREGQSGNPALLAAAMSALADVRKIWGLDAPEKVDGTFGGSVKFYVEGSKVDAI